MAGVMGHGEICNGDPPLACNLFGGRPDIAGSDLGWFKGTTYFNANPQDASARVRESKVKLRVK